MKHKAPKQSHLPVSIRNLTITTKLRLHPEFAMSPRAFARRNGVDLADDIFLETDFKRDPDDPGSGKRLEKTKLNIHLVRHGAIRLFAEHDNDGDWVRSIDLNPSMLLYEAKRHLLTEGDLLLSLEKLKDQVSRLLADSHDVRHTIPGLVYDEEPVAHWSLVDSEILLPGIQIPCLHGISHPRTGPAEGVKNNRIQLGDKQDDCVIRFKEARGESFRPAGTQNVEGVRVRLILKGSELTPRFKPFGTTALIGEEEELVAFSERSVACVHQQTMSELKGTCLPVPPVWRDRDRGKPVTHAKTIALVSQLTSIPLDDLRAMDEEIRHPSKSTRKRLNKDVPVEVGRLVPFPASTLFGSAVYASQEWEGTPRPSGRIDPQIVEAYS